MPNITYEEVPQWYQLKPEGSKIQILIHNQAQEFLKDIITPATPIVRGLQNAGFDFFEFVPPTEQAWGFGSCLYKADQSEPKYTAWNCRLPQVLRSDFKSDPIWEPAYAISATLQVLFSALLVFDDKTDAEHPQLLVIDGFRTAQEMYGGALTVSVSKTLRNWLDTIPENSRLPKVEEDMKAAHDQMWVKSAYDDMDFRAALWHPPGIHLSCPGNACGLDPYSIDDLKEDCDGYQLVPHNTDTPIQQLTLLMGVASLYEQAYTDMTNKDPAL